MATVNADVCVVGAGPAGLSASIEAARAGLDVVLLDSNMDPGGQLLKQIHKFFGSKEHRAGTRGIDIARILYKEALDAGVKVWLDSSAYGIFSGNVVEVARGVHESHAGKGRAWKEIANAKKIVLAVGASENPVQFQGWTLPGVTGAGAAQTMINVERVLPGKRVVMVGSGNVGLIVSYQLTQAGAEVVAIVEAAPSVGGYAVHAAKVLRAGVPILTSHTVKAARGDGEVSQVEIAQVDSAWQPVQGTERTLDADTVCVATGLRPFLKLASLAGCELGFAPALGGWVPTHTREMESSVPGIYVAGDLAGVEEASTAMEEGRVAGLSVVKSLGAGDPGRLGQEIDEACARLDALRMGPFGEARARAKKSLTTGGVAV
jgi:thioredoxin reductase